MAIVRASPMVWRSESLKLVRAMARVRLRMGARMATSRQGN